MKNKKKLLIILLVGFAIIVILIFTSLVIAFVFSDSSKPKEIVVKNNSQQDQNSQSNQEEQEEKLPVAKKEDLEKKKIDNYLSKKEKDETNDKVIETGNLEENENQEEASPKAETEDKKTEEESSEEEFITTKQINWGFQKTTGRDVDTIVVHSSYDALHDDPYNLKGLLEEYKKYGVAPHFVVDRDGKVFQLVDTEHIAYHAGEGEMPDGRKSINAFSVGVELMNTKEDEYSKKQYESVNELVDYLENKYNIEYILGHKDIAPERKTDPWNFDWDQLKSKNSIHN
ncbi:MAG: N-acetylmuramoyl-L-alanine amidase [Candidatus Moraniibacteriota bacterium]